MFIVEGRQSAAEFRDQHEIDNVISSLARLGHRPALRGIMAAAAEIAVVGRNAIPVDFLLDKRRTYRRLGPQGDFMFKDNYAHFIQPVGRRLHVWEVRHHLSSAAIDEFCKLVEQATRSNLDGRRVRGMDFSWRVIKGRAYSRYTDDNVLYQETKLDTKPPDYSSDEAIASRILVNLNVRTFLLRLAQVGKARATDAISDSQGLPINTLLEHKLIRKEFLVLCKKDSHTICTVQNPSDIEDSTGKGFKCAVCGRNLNDETFQEIFALSDEGRSLITKSRWMSIWITELLISAGIAKDKIAWNATASSDELDIIIDGLGPKAFFELKDREFGLGDAYPFSYRVSRYGGKYGVIATTEKVSGEAKKFFEEATQRNNKIVFLEGSEPTEKEIPKLIDQISRFGALQLLMDLSGSLAIDPGPILGAWMDRVAITINRISQSEKISQPILQ